MFGVYSYQKRANRVLSEKFTELLTIDYAIVHRKTLLTKNPILCQNLSNCSLDTLVLLHAVNVSRRDPFTDLVIACSDKSSFFKRLLRIFERFLQPSKRHSLLDFQLLAGCDKSGKFFKNLYNCRRWSSLQTKSWKYCMISILLIYQWICF